jgi:hypothetical protein
MSQVDYERLVPLLRKTIDGGCHTPITAPAYTKHHRIQMPRVLTDAEQAEFEIRLGLLPCNVKYVPGHRGEGMDMILFNVYQGG